jgi:hypothetical protein
VNDDTRFRSLRTQLRATQLVALLCVFAIAALAWRQSKPVTELHAGDTTLSGDLFGISAWSKTNAELGVLSRHGTSVRLVADDLGTSLGMRSGDQSLLLSARRSGASVSLLVSGVVRSRLVFDTRTGALRLVRSVEGQEEVVTELAGPLR